MPIFNLKISGDLPQDSVAAWADLGLLSKRSLHPGFQERLCQEILIIEQMGMTGSFIELYNLGKDLKESGHQIKILGSAASSALLYALGFSSLCPEEYGFYFERFLDPKCENSKTQLDLVGMVSQSGIQFLQQLGKRNYSVQKESDTSCNIGVKGTLEWIVAGNVADSDKGRIHLQITAPSVLAVTNLLPVEESQNCLGDSKTWDLIRNGDTDGIDGLDEPEMKGVLRNRKPGTLEELASSMVALLPVRNKGYEGFSVFQEDLMKSLHQEAGIPLRESYQFVRPVVLGNLKAVDLAKQKLFGMARINGIPDGEIQNIWDRINAKGFQAHCKAHIYSGLPEI